jgi:hypothetical protein
MALKDHKYNVSPKGRRRYATYRARHWQRVEVARLRWNRTRRERRLSVHTED